jgi:Tfp pilus assembly protein PilE
VELLIVVSVIGILASIILPQYAAYRIRGHNVSALADMKSFKTVVETYFVDKRAYP